MGEFRKLIFVLIVFSVVILGCSGESKFDEVEQMGELKLTSPAFKDGGRIPDKYTCEGENISPPLEISGVPQGAKSLVLIVDDPDAPMGTWDHWIVWNIDPTTTKIGENSTPEGAVQGLNDFRQHEYGGPAPPSGTHRYIFKLYALNITLKLHDDAVKQDVENAMNGNVIAQTQLMGTFSRG